MDFRASATYGLQRSRWFVNQILNVLQSDDDWFHQVHPQCSHALWITGHLGLADNMFASRFRSEQDLKPEGFQDLFWFGTQLQERNAYPAVEEVRSYFNERRENLLSLVNDLSDEELAAPAPAADALDPIAGAPGMGELLLFASKHENMHAGQLTVIHRSLGHSPLFGP